MEQEVVYFELNHWSEQYHPPVEPFVSWMSDYYETPEEEAKSWIQAPEIMDKWYKDNKLCVVTSIIDMSVNFCVTALKSWVDENCPEIYNYPQFLRQPDEYGDVEGQFGGHFVKWSEENCGRWDDYEEEDSQGYTYYNLEKWREEDDT